MKYMLYKPERRSLQLHPKKEEVFSICRISADFAVFNKLTIYVITPAQFVILILSCDLPVVLDTVRWYRIVQSKHN